MRSKNTPEPHGNTAEPVQRLPALRHIQNNADAKRRIRMLSEADVLESEFDLNTDALLILKCIAEMNDRETITPQQLAERTGASVAKIKTVQRKLKRLIYE